MVLLREAEHLNLCLRLQCPYCADLGSEISAWLTYLMGSDICLSVCSLKMLYQGDGLTGLSLGLWHDSTCFAPQVPEPVLYCDAATAMARLLGLEQQSQGIGSSAKGPRPGSRSCLGQCCLGPSHWLESSPGIPNDGYSLQCFPGLICFLMPPLLALAVAMHQGLI